MIDEHYDNGERHSKHINHYKNYVFHPKFEGVAILDLKSAPKNYVGDLHQIRMKEFREEHDLINCGITLEAVLSDTDGKLEQSFLVTVVTRIWLYDTIMTQLFAKTHISSKHKVL